MVDVFDIMNWSGAFYRLACSAAALLPLMVSADSQLQAGAATDGANASAHIDFKIVIPKFLYLQADSTTAAIAANSRSLTLQAGDESNSAGKASVVLRAVAHKGIEQQTQCAPATAGPAATRVVCTAATP
jgi:hypothetical protein